MSTSKHHLVPVYICMYCRYLEFKKPSFSLSLDSCNDKFGEKTKTKTAFYFIFAMFARFGVWGIWLFGVAVAIIVSYVLES
jgi:hypothetical protein